ncbi:transposase [Lutibacter profundi]|uniref:Transposase n=1 Tax=Lutibacter profundi TaxID=1622118 RepID=A0A0X8G6X8_9FLAO|nr:IS4 family transposase [Lutibacter profundi]AMC10023.1 transposase [Lutibacter profundi]AMC10871.1 transposase [Lutibacter profundi]AMC11175.1 transposase [Lutibacter profundi]
MNKSTHFSGTPIIKQILKYIPQEDITRTAKTYNSDRYYKKFKTYDHLVTMLYATMSGVSSLRELSTVLLACEGRISHLNLKHFPKRSTLSDANRKRTSEVFGAIYSKLLQRYAPFLSDSSPLKPTIKNLKIVDSTTISLFSDILKGVGRNPLNGKKKGGIKMHTMINALEDVPCLIRFSSAATHDHTFLKELNLEKDSFVVFDKAYNDYLQYLEWTLNDIYFVTRQKDNAVYKSIKEFDLADKTSDAVLKDELILIKKDDTSIQIRRVAYWDATQEKVYEFITNNVEISPDQVADIYKHRWQIETMFKRLKQNFPLKYFLGDNQNAIEIQIWSALIIQLIILVIQRKIKRKWAYSNMISVMRFHLMTYIDLFKFLENPNKQWWELTSKPPDIQLQLFK